MFLDALGHFEERTGFHFLGLLFAFRLGRHTYLYPWASSIVDHLFDIKTTMPVVMSLGCTVTVHTIIFPSIAPVLFDKTLLKMVTNLHHFAFTVKTSWFDGIHLFFFERVGMIVIFDKCTFHKAHLRRIQRCFVKYSFRRLKMKSHRQKDSLSFHKEHRGCYLTECIDVMTDVHWKLYTGVHNWSVEFQQEI